MIEWHPVAPLVVGLVLTLTPWVALRRFASIATPLAAAAVLALLPDGAEKSAAVLGYQLTYLHVTDLGSVFAMAFALFASLAGIYGWHESTRFGSFMGLLLAFGGIGVCMAGDFLSLYVFWEALTVGSVFIIWLGGRPDSRAAGFRYLMFHLAGGVALLTGVLIQIQTGGGMIRSLDASTLAGTLIVIGFLTNAAVPPLHAWLPDAYPRATPVGTVFLSAFTTKSAVYALARVFPGTEILVWLGAIMTLYGVVFAVLENNIRRLLGYHIISQVGYMVCGAGLGTAIAINGSAAHAFSHIFYKGLLLMSVGAVIYSTGRGKLSELGGLARPLMWVAIFCGIGAFSISGVPLFNGFISKSMIKSASTYAERGPIEMILLVASMGTFLSIGLKLLWFTFFNRSKEEEVEVMRPVPRPMYIAMTGAAVVCIGTGIVPGLLYSHLPYPAQYHPYTAEHVVGNLQLLFGTALGFWILRGRLGGKALISRDMDRLYLGPVKWATDGAGTILQDLGARVRAFNLAWVFGSYDQSRRYVQTVSGAPLALHAAIILAGLAGVGLLILSASS